MLLEIWQNSQFPYATIPVKNFDVKDLQGLVLEKTSTEEDLQSPEALYRSLKQQKPNEGEHILAATKADIWKDTNVSAQGVYKIDPNWFAALPA